MNPVRNNPVRAGQMMRMLIDAPQTYEMLAAGVGLSKVAVATWIKVMRKAGMVYICDWTDDVRGRKFTPMFRWGNKKDIPRAGQARTSAERMQAYRARLKAKEVGK